MSRSRRLRAPVALAASALLHLGLLAFGAWLLHASLSEGAARAPTPVPTATFDVTIAEGSIELPPMSAHANSGAQDPSAVPEPEPVGGAQGGERMPRPDMPDPGRGGSDEVTEAALNLADSNDGLTLDRDPLNRLDRSQIQRLKTAQVRESLEDRRATPNPMELSFVASGKGKLAIFRPPAKRDPSRGAARGAAQQSPGGQVGGPELEDGQGAEPEPGTAQSGTGKKVAALGVSSGSPGKDYRRSASVMLARPMVTQGRAAVPAPTKGRPNDTQDSSQDVATVVASLIHASTAGGKLGAGGGGERAPGPTASGGGPGRGSRSAASGSGPGSLTDVGADANILGYFRALERKVEPHWRHAFPAWAIAEGRGGLAVLTLVLRHDGSLASVSVTRQSGIPEFDANVVAAVRRAAPFGPLPPRLRPGPQPLRMTFDATNPAVGRDGPGRGGRLLRNDGSARGWSGPPTSSR